MVFNRVNWFLFFQTTVFAVLIVLSVIFYRERLLADSGYYLMRVINSRMPWIEHGRFILFFSQVLPWIGVTFQVPLKVVLILYSLNHVLFPLLIFYLVVLRFNNPMAGVFMIILQLAGIVTGFLVPMFELYYAASMLVLFAAILYKGSTGIYNNLILLTLAFFIVSSHPMGIVLLLMVSGYHALDFGKKYQWLYLQIVILLMTLLLFKYFTASDYEAGKSAAILQGLKAGKYNLGFFTQLAGFLLKNYYTLMVIAIVVIALFISRRDYLKLGFYLASVTIIGLLSALNTGVFELSRYVEQVWFPLVFGVSFPLMIGLAEKLKRNVSLIFALLFLLLILHRLRMITDMSLSYNHRTSQMMRLTAHAGTYGGQWFIIDDYNISNELIPGANWSYPIETMLLSALDGPSKTVSLCTLEDYLYEDNFKKLNLTNYLFRRFEVEPLSNINTHYFSLAHGTYLPMNNKSILEADKALPATAVSLSLSKSDKTYKRNSIIYLPVEISTTVQIPSNREYGYYLSAVWEGEDKELSSAIVIPIEVDIANSYVQELILRTPEIPGFYTLNVELKNAKEDKIITSEQTGIKVR